MIDWLRVSCWIVLLIGLCGAAVRDPAMRATPSGDVALMGNAHMNRKAQKMLADAGFTRIENDEIWMGPIKILLNRRAIECLNQQGNDTLPMYETKEITFEE